jgi:hypothetical protein
MFFNPEEPFLTRLVVLKAPPELLLLKILGLGRLLVDRIGSSNVKSIISFILIKIKKVFSQEC